MSLGSTSCRAAQRTWFAPMLDIPASRYVPSMMGVGGRQVAARHSTYNTLSECCALYKTKCKIEKAQAQHPFLQVKR